MGKLITRGEIGTNARWYFSDAYYSGTDTSSYTKGYGYAWPSNDYPHMLAIHEEELTGKLRIIIRSWIESKIDDTVIYEVVEKDYTPSPTRSVVRNHWYTFHFQSEESAIMFKLRFHDITRTMSDTNPFRN